MKRYNYLLRISRNLGHGPVFIYGLRGVGKTSLLQTFYKDFILTNGASSVKYYDLESMEHRDPEMIAAALEAKLIILDEITYLPQWEETILRLYSKGIRIIFSSSRLSRLNLPAPLSEIVISTRLLPYSYRELLSLRDERFCDLSDEDILKKLISEGGLPALYNLSSREQKDQYLAELFERIIEDICAGPNSFDSKMVRVIIENLYRKVGLNYSARENRALNSVVKDIAKIEMTGIIDRLPPLSLNSSNNGPLFEKYYAFDLAFLRVLKPYSELELSSYLENAVYLELNRCGYQVYDSRSSLINVDFTAIRNDRHLFINVASNIGDHSEHAKLIKRLSVIPENGESLLITLDRKDFSTQRVKHLHLKDFLKMNDL